MAASREKDLPEFFGRLSARTHESDSHLSWDMFQTRYMWGVYYLWPLFMAVGSPVLASGAAAEDRVVLVKGVSDHRRRQDQPRGASRRHSGVGSTTRDEMRADLFDLGLDSIRVMDLLMRWEEAGLRPISASSSKRRPSMAGGARRTGAEFLAVREGAHPSRLRGADARARSRPPTVLRASGVKRERREGRFVGRSGAALATVGGESRRNCHWHRTCREGAPGR